MYTSLKNIIKSILPHRTLIKLEPALRSCIYPFYKGDAYECNCCGAKLNRFIPLKNDLLCPKCGSIARDRVLISLLTNEFDVLTKPLHLLDFSPSRAVYRFMKKANITGYRGTDLSGDFIADHTYDITGIDCDSNTFDLIICFHVLEHVLDDISAMKELKRILKDGGICLIQTPFKEGEIYEDPSITSESERRIHFGQEDHVRIYSVAGLTERLKSVGFEVEVKDIYLDQSPNSVNTSQVILFCK